ncbi:MAG: hypothetical protein HQL83_16865 [Magnetococcales bacterium]|nr:hypothetical protein [Magnetococcales bacterium]
MPRCATKNHSLGSGANKTMNSSETLLATDLAGSVQTPCGIRPLVFRYPGDPTQFGSSPSKPPTGRERRHTLEEMQHLRTEGRVTQMNEAHLVPIDHVALFARPSFLLAYALICGEPFPWQSFHPVGVMASIDPTKEKERFPQILSDRPWSLHNQVLAALGSTHDIHNLLAQARTKIHVRGEHTACLYLKYPKNSENCLNALDLMKEIGWLEIFCTKGQAPDLLFESYEFTGLSLYERGGEGRLESLFATGIHPLAPQTKFQDFLDHVRRFKDKLDYRHTCKSCHCASLVGDPSMSARTIKQLDKIFRTANEEQTPHTHGKKNLDLVTIAPVRRSHQTV